jgi:peptidoglycan/LPS O-acetylase OafA/YrhL
MQKDRIQLLDSFRFLAVTGVILYHYAYRWAPPIYDGNLYPFGRFFGNDFEYGYLGVEFFFVISGFVISYTLENTTGLSTFAKNRFSRLFPAMLLWSTITFVVLTFLDNKNIFPGSHDAANFLPSLTFTNPQLWSLAFRHSFQWLSGSYWSLWVEIEFYIIAALIYYSNKEKFLKRMLAVSLMISFITYIPQHFAGAGRASLLPEKVLSLLNSAYFMNNLFPIGYYIGFFTIGVILFYLYKGFAFRAKSLTGAGIFLVFSYQLYAGVSLEVRLFFALMVVLFLLMIYRRRYLFFLENRLFRRIGVISYSVYLAHEQIGVLLINKYGGYLGKWSPLSVLLVMVLIIGLAELSYRFVEQKAGRLLKSGLSNVKFRTTRVVKEAS